MTRLSQPGALIGVLLNSNAPFGDRHDAAMDLARFDEVEAESALTACLLDKATSEDLADACAESLAEVWARKRKVDERVLDAVPSHATGILLATLDALFPGWRQRT